MEFFGQILKKRKILILLLAGTVFTWRFLFTITVMLEERFVETENQLVVTDLKVKGDKIVPVYLPPLKEIRIGSFTFLINSIHSVNPFNPPSCPAVMVKSNKKEYFLCGLSYGALTVPYYLIKLYLFVFGKNIYSARSIFLITFLLFMFIYLKFNEKMSKNGELLSLYFITFPICGAAFAIPTFWNQVITFIIECLLIMKFKKILEERIVTSIDAFYLLFFSGFLLHVHLIIGGALLFSMIIAFLLVERKIFFRIKPIPLICGGFIFFIFLAPYVISPFTGIINILINLVKKPFYGIFLSSFLNFVYFIIAIFAPLVYIELPTGLKCIPFSIPSAIILVFGIIGLFWERKIGKFQRFLFITCIVYIFLFLSFSSRPYHITYVLLFFVPFISDGLKKIKIFSSEKIVKLLLLIAIFYNYVQLEVWRKFTIESSDSLPIHKEVASYLLKNNITRIHDLAGPYGYNLISRGKVEVIDFTPFIEKNYNTYGIYLSLLASKNEVVLLGSEKAWFKKGISFEKATIIAQEKGLKLEVLKKFPSDEKPVLVLAKVLSP
jgi:hypothetical protein